jgi:hypothetical protein
MLAHIAGVPVEETLLGFAPLGVGGVGALLVYGSRRVRAAWRRPGRAARHDPL